MASRTTKRIRYQVIQLADARFAVVPEHLIRMLCRRAGFGAVCVVAGGRPDGAREDYPLDGQRLARRLIERRRRAGLTQAELARRAGIRGETLNRIERGKTEPDFATIRKLVTAMNLVESRGEGAWRADSTAEWEHNDARDD